jgi:hypothetical protein
MPSLYPVEKFADFKIEEVPELDHYHTWVDSALSGERTTAGFHYAGPLAEAVLLGNIATRCPGKLLKWKSDELKFANSPEANKLLSKQYRKGFEI